MRQISADAVTEAVADLFKQANYELGDDVLAALKKPTVMKNPIRP